jgi:hypothetical protein
MRRTAPFLAALALLAAAPALALGQDTTAVRADSAIARPEPRPRMTMRRPAPMRVARARLAPPGERLRRATDGGRYVALADGTVWEVHPSDRTGSDAWMGPAYIVVRTNPAPRRSGGVAYDYLLINGAEGRTVAARFVGVGR